MGKTKTSILVDPNLWQRFKREVAKRYKGRRASIPPVSSVVEDLVRGWLEGLHRVKIPVYEAAYLASLEPKVLFKYARVNPDLAFRILQARPQAFLELVGVGFTPRSPEEAKKRDLDYYYAVGEDKIILHWYDDWDKTWFPGDTWHFIASNKGAPYFNPWILEVLLGEGWPEAVAVRYLGVEELCAMSYVTFSVGDPEGWQRLLAILEDLVGSGVRPARTYLRGKECDAIRLTRESMAAGEEAWNGVRFLRLLSTWIPSNTQGNTPYNIVVG